MTQRVLSAAIGDYPHTAALADTPILRLARARIAPINLAFAPMVRELRFDVCEMAIATFLMAKEAGIPITLLPVVMAERYQEGAIVCPIDSPIRGPGDLAGRRVGVRAYSQTTGMWLRGVLADGHGVPPDSVAWTTFEDAHVPTFRDPPFVTRAMPGSDIVAMLRAKELDAAIFGFEVPQGMRTVFPDPAAAGQDFQSRYGFKPVNHLVVVKSDLARDAAVMGGLDQIFGASRRTRESLAPAITLAAEFCASQGLIAKPLTWDEVWS